MKKILLVLAAAAFATGASAEGYQVNNMSAKQTGMGHVGTAMKLDSESIFFNPAAASFQKSKFDISAGFTGILASCAYRSLPTLANDYTSGPAEKSDNKLSTPLHVYFNYKPIERLSVGLGFFTPNGSSMRWSDQWSGAHLVQEINLAAYTVQPTVSYRICDRLSIGAGLMITWGNFDLARSMLSPTTITGLVQTMIDPTIGQLQGALNAGYPLSDEQQAMLQTLQGAKGFLEANRDRTLVLAKLQGNADVAVGVNAGAMWDITDQWSIGMTWRSRMNMQVGRGHATMKVDPTAAQLIAQLGQLSPGTQLLPPLDKGTFNA